MNFLETKTVQNYEFLRNKNCGLNLFLCIFVGIYLHLNILYCPHLKNLECFRTNILLNLKKCDSHMSKFFTCLIIWYSNCNSSILIKLIWMSRYQTLDLGCTHVHSC